MKQIIIDRHQMTQDQLFCFRLLSDLLGGYKLVPPVYKDGSGIKIHMLSGRLSTFDSIMLTKLVFLCHDRCVRAEIISSGSNRVGIALRRRHKRDGAFYESHPTIEQALEQHRKDWGNTFIANTN